MLDIFYTLVIVLLSHSIYGLESDKIGVYNVGEKHGDLVFLANKDIIRVYDTYLNVKWENNIRTKNYTHFFSEFNTIYAIDKEYNIDSIDIHTGLIQTKYYGEIKKYFLQYPFMVISSGKSLKMVDVSSHETLWEKTRKCEDVMIFSSSEYVGCLTQKKLMIWNSVTGKKNDSKNFSGSPLTYLSSSNRYAFFEDKNQTLMAYNFKEKKINEALSIPLNNKIGFIRQKEILIKNEELKNISSFDIESQRNTWVHTFKSPYEDVLANDRHVFVKFPSHNYAILDNYSGDVEFTFNSKEDNVFTNTFFKQGSRWVFINKEIGEYYRVSSMIKGAQ